MVGAAGRLRQRQLAGSTGDVFLGNATTTYRNGLTIEHRGFANGTAVVDYLTDTFPGATQVVMTGASAGAVASPVYGAMVADRLPEVDRLVAGEPVDDVHCVACR